MIRGIFVCLFVFLLIAVFWFPKQTVQTVHSFWQSTFVRTSITYSESNGVPVSKILPKNEQRTEFIHHR